jgi:alpha-methylacyl-CoA racemase
MSTNYLRGTSSTWVHGRVRSFIDMESGIMKSGPLTGVRLVEFGATGPAPFGAMVLADMGADVVRIERHASYAADSVEAVYGAIVHRGRRSAVIDLRDEAGVAAVLPIVDDTDVLIEGFRPGVMERLGLGPDVCLARNPGLIYTRVTGWGQDGPWASKAGHDINFVALSGALELIASSDGEPVPPPGLLGDFAAGGLSVAFAVAAALYERERSGEGQIIDVSVVDATALLLAPVLAALRGGSWAQTFLEQGAPFNDVYRTNDGRWIAFGAIEPQFYRAMLEGLGLGSAPLPGQLDVAGWPMIRAAITARVEERTLAEWEETFARLDACFAPVLTPDEAAEHPHLLARGTFQDVSGVRQPGPSPRFSRTPGRITATGPAPGAHTDEVLYGPLC